MKRRLIISLIAVSVLAAAYFSRGPLRDSYAKWQRGPIPEAINREEAIASQPEETEETVSEPAKPPAEAPPKPSTPPNITAKINLRVVFIPQAPFKVWDEIHEDTCEESSMLMLQAYLAGENSLSNEEMERRILAVVDYQKATHGDFKSSDAERTAAIMRDHLGLKNAKAVPLSSMDDVKRMVAAGNPVMLPSAGRLLYNPNFKNGGPIYHMIVVKGYDGSRIITNDPGTRLGADYVYDEKVLWNAIADWTGSGVDNSKKFMIVVK